MKENERSPDKFTRNAASSCRQVARPPRKIHASLSPLHLRPVLLPAPLPTQILPFSPVFHRNAAATSEFSLFSTNIKSTVD